MRLSLTPMEAADMGRNISKTLRTTIREEVKIEVEKIEKICKKVKNY